MGFKTKCIHFDGLSLINFEFMVLILGPVITSSHIVLGIVFSAVGENTRMNAMVVCVL